MTLRAETIGVMSCNPAIGGLGKGHLVREIDALDGVMGRVADAAGIQFRLLNRRKGPAVRGPRTQADRKLYRLAMRAAIERSRASRRSRARWSTSSSAAASSPAVRAGGGETHRLRRRGADDRDLPARADPYRRAQIRGRPHEREGVARPVRDIRRAGFTLGRLKTGTPPRLDGRTIDWASLEMQAATTSRAVLLADRPIAQPADPCGITRTTRPPTT